MATCSACGQSNPEPAGYCLSCGSPLDRDVAQREERKVVTVLFCDVVGSTARFDRADPEDVGTVLAAYHDCVRREIERFGGTMEKFIGDAVMAVYGAPLAREDDPQRAVLSALRIPPAIDELNQANPDFRLDVRIGVETGEAVVSVGVDRHRRGLAMGDMVNTASRLQQVAPIGGIVVSEGTYRLTKDVFEYEPLKPVRVKGKAEPLHIWRAKAARSRFGVDLQRRHSTPLVDREDELELLKRTFSRAVREPSVQLVTLMGEPGVGKSRVIKEFFAYIDDLPDLVFWRQGRCLPYGEGVTFWALSEIVKAQAGILESDGAGEAGDKLSESVASFIEDAAEREWVRARLAPLIGLAESHPEGFARGEAFSAWGRYLEAMASRYPLVMVIEDLHWADPALLDFVEYVGEWSGIPMLMLCSARLDILERDRRWGGGKRNASTMSLAPLNSEDTRRLISLLLPSGIAAATRDFLAERTGGNPLFAEEFARMLIDRPSLAEEDRTAPPVAGDSTPENLKAIIAARLDTLPAPQKSLLQDASVVGKVFWPGALAAIGESDGGRVHEGLKELTRKEFVRASRVSSVEHEMEYSFWHALIRDVTYSQIPRATRARKHIAAARWIEGLAGERISDHAELLAYHFEQALTMSKLAGIGAEIASLEEATRRYWMLAGERAMGLDVSRALACFDRALELSPVDDEVRARLLARKAEAASDAGRYETAQQAYVEAIEAFRGQGNLVGAGESLDKLATVLWERGDTKTSRARLAEAVEVLAGQLPGPELAHCYTSVASDRLVTGRFGEAVEWSDRALDLAEKLGEERLVPRALNYRGMSRCYLGDPGGFDDLRHALELTERLGSSREKARALVILTEVQWATEHPVRALRAAEEGADFASRRGLDDMVIGCRTQTLGPLFDLGRWDEVLEVAEEVIHWSDTSGGTYSASLAVPWKEQVLLWRGQTSEAESIASDSLARARGMKDPQVLVPSVVVAAMVGLGQGRREEAIRLVRDLDETTEVAINWYREEFIADLARICCGVGDVELGRTLIAKAEPFATRHRLSILSGQATLDEAIGQLGRAADTYRAASFRWSEYGNVFEAGLARLGQGRCLARMGHPDARDHLLKARSVFRELGATVLLAETDQWLQEPQAPELRDHPD